MVKRKINGIDKVLVKHVLLITFLFFGNGIVLAQVRKSDFDVDSLKSKLKKAIVLDTAKLKTQLQFDKKFNKLLKQKVKESGIEALTKKDSLIKTGKIKLKDFAVENSGQYTQSDVESAFPKYLNHVEIAGQLELFKFPLNLNLINASNPFGELNFNKKSMFNLNFAKPKFDVLYADQINKFKDFSKKKLSGERLEVFLKNTIQSRLQDKFGEDLKKYPKLQAYLNNPNSVKDLLKLNKEEINHKLEYLLKVDSSSLTETLKASSAEVKELEKAAQTKIATLAQEVETLQSDLISSGLNRNTIDFIQKFVENKVTEKEIERFFQDELLSQAKFSGIQKYYSKIKEFQAGNFGHILPGSFINKDLLLNGFNFSLKTGRGPVNVGIVSNQDLNGAKDFGFSQSNFSNPKLFTYLSVPTTRFAFGSGKLAWVSAYDKQFDNKSFSTSSINVISQNNMVFTLTQDLKLAKLGKLTVDISKSSTQYKNLNSIGLDALFINQDGISNFFRDDFLQTMSVGLIHEIDSKKTGLNTNLFINYAGSGFKSAAIQGLNNTNLRFGGNLKKIMFRNKLSFQLKGDFKNTPIAADENMHWRNYNVQFDTRFRLSKSYYINLKYIENGIDKVGGAILPFYQSRKIQGDLNANYKIGSKYSFSHLTFGKQSIFNPGLSDKPDFLMLNYAQSILFNDFSLNGNLFVNKEIGKTKMLGNILNSDLSCQYQVFRTVSLSTGMSYLDNEEIAKQIGVKQSIQFMFKNHFDVSASMDLRKNIIQPIYPELYTKGRAEFSIRYYFDKQ